MWLLFVGVLTFTISQVASLQVGVAISDVTGPAAEVTFVSQHGFVLLTRHFRQLIMNLRIFE